jgi:alpha/beta hydrolase fold
LKYGSMLRLTLWSLTLSSARALTLSSATSIHARATLRLMSSSLHATPVSPPHPPSADKFKDTSMYPPPPLIEEGMLKVSDRHSIYYHVYGNPKGKNALFVHGGPGGGTDAAMARYFDPQIYRVILVDQRGCGKSLPFADLEDNNTQALISDFEKIRVKLEVDTWLVFGGSWGSTLSLAYAVRSHSSY